MVESEAEAREIITQLGGKKPKKFETLAARSKDTGTVASGGALGWVHLGDLEQPFPIVLGTLKKGEYTKTPVKSHFGWHVIKLDDIRESKVPSFEEVKPQLQQRLKQRATNLATFGQDFEGNVSDGKKNGWGVLTWADGSRYEGEFRDNQYHGKGLLTDTKGNRFEGEFRGGQFISGKAIAISADGDRYEGVVRDGKKNGSGVTAWAGGSRYEGDWRDDKKNGFGTLSLVKGSPFIQSWTDNGKGQWMGDQYVVQGMFENDSLVLVCSSKESCKETQDRKDREERYKYEHACDSYYPGRTGQIKGKGWFATSDGFIVRYVNKDRRMVTIEGTTGGNSLKNGQVEEFSCEGLKGYEQ